MNTLLPNPRPERHLLSGFAIPILIAIACLSPTPLVAQQADASDGFDVIATERSEIDDMHQFLDLHLKLGNTGEAERYAKEILVRNSKDPDALGALLGIHLKRRSAKSALTYARRYRAVRPGAEADALLASALRLNGLRHEALAVMLRRYAKVPKGAHFPQLLELCYCYYDVRKIAEARACFLKVRDDKRFSAKQRAEAVRELAAIRREEEIRDAYLALERRDLKKARRIANELQRREKKPNRDVTALVAVLDADEHGKVDEAVATIERLKATHRGSEPFPYQSTLALLLLDQGRYEEAEAAAAEAQSARTPFLTAEDARGRLETMRLVREYTRSMVSAEGTYLSQDEGKTYRAKVVASMPLNKNRTRVGVEYTFSDLDFDTPPPRGANETDYHGALATVSHRFTPTITGEAAAGAIAGHFAYRVAARMSRPSQADFLELSFRGNHRPTDTMTLEAFGGRENRITIKGKKEIPANRRITVSGEAFYREVEIDHPLVDDLGTGWGARWEVEYLLYKFRRMMVSAAYVGAFENFDYSGDAQRTKNHTALRRPPLHIVEDDLHKHGIVLRGRAPLGEDVMAHVELGADYRLDDEQMVYSAAAGLEWWVAEYTRLTASGAYYTSGLAGNAGSGYFEANVGVTTNF